MQSLQVLSKLKCKTTHKRRLKSSTRSSFCRNIVTDIRSFTFRHRYSVSCRERFGTIRTTPKLPSPLLFYKHGSIRAYKTSLALSALVAEVNRSERAPPEYRIRKNTHRLFCGSRPICIDMTEKRAVLSLFRKRKIRAIHSSKRRYPCSALRFASPSL